MASSIGRLIGNSWQVVRLGSALGRAVQSEVSQRLEASDSTVLSGVGKLLSPAQAAVPESQLPASLRLTRRVLSNVNLSNETRRALTEGLAESPPCKNSRELQESLQERLGDEVSAQQIADRHPNFFPALLASGRSHPPLAMKGRLALDLAGVAAKNIKFYNDEGRLYAEVKTSLNQLLKNNPRSQQIAQDYASKDVSLKLTVPLGEGNPKDYRDLEVAAKRQLLTSALRSAPGVTALVHGFQSTKEIWDSTAHQWLEPGHIGIACDGFGADGQACSDASAPYTPKQYAFQMLETLDALGMLGGKHLRVVGHSMGGAATGEMVVALDKAGYSGKADFVLMAPACSPDHMPIFQAHRDLVDVVNATLIGGIYVPLGAWDLTAPLVQWTDEKFPIFSKMMVDHGLGLKDSPEHIRNHNADYYRSPNALANQQRRNRSMEAMMGMATQQGIDPKELRHAAKKFGVFVVNFGLDRLVDPEAVRRLKGKGVGYMEVAPGSHNACFVPRLAEQISAASNDHFATRP